MGEGLQFATLATLVGKRNGAWWMGQKRVTIGAVGIRGKERWVMGTFENGDAVFGPPEDFPTKRTTND